MASQTHFIAKADLFKHAVAEVPTNTTPLEDGAIRARSKILSVTMTTKAYAQLGSVFGWWSAWPAPADAPAPYNDSSTWGIVPSWGYAEVVESNNADLPEGTLMFGQFITSSAPVVLKFKSSGTPGHFTEISEHRKPLLTIYNQFQIADKSISEDKMAWNSAVMLVWSAGWILTKFNFPTGNIKPVHPLGPGEWTAKDADLKSTVIVSLAASSKTARGLAWGLQSREPGNSPLGVIEVASSPQSLQAIKSDDFEAKTTSYDDLSGNEVVSWIGKLKPSRVLVIDFGGRTEALQKFHDTILASDAAPAALDYLVVGADPNALKTSDERVRRLQMNTSPIMDVGMAAEGIDSVYEGRRIEFEKWMAAGGHGSMTLKWGSGIAGEDGIEGAWEALMNDKLPRDKALVFRI